MQYFYIQLTAHAIKQGKKRMGLSPNSILKLAYRAIERSEPEQQMDGTTRYMYGEKSFVFAGNLLVTIYETKMISPYTVLYRKGKKRVEQTANIRKA